MHYGGDYNPEQWPREVWDEDIRLMREAGVTLVSVGIFSWSRIQPAEGVFDFEWLDDIMGRLHAAGIAVDLATGTASPPPWMHANYPEILPVTADGTTLGPGSRQHYAPTSPVYRRLATELVTALAQRYADHPAVVMWHVNNEYGCHVDQDYSDSAAAAFRLWLQRRYGSLGGLNAAWGTDFWSQRYAEWDQILPPRLAPFEVNPAQTLDFRRFSSDALLDLYLMEKQIILASGSTLPITTNFMGKAPGMDYWAWAPHVDVISDDCYPDPQDATSFRSAGAFHRDLMRSLGGGPGWMLMEQASSAVNWRPSNGSRPAGANTAQSIQAIARGADAVMYFQWRQSRSGAEKFHSAMLPHAGVDTPLWRETVSIGQTLAALPALPTVDATARVGLVYDWQILWALEGAGHPVQLDYQELVTRWYAALHERGIGVDFVSPSSDLTQYDLVVAPQVYMLTDAQARNLADFAHSGGTLFVGAFSDVVNENAMFLDGGFTTRLGEALGVRVIDFGALPLEEDHPFATVRAAGDIAFAGELLAEDVVEAGADVLARFTDGQRAGGAALTSNTWGAGRAFYAATIPHAAGTGALVDLLTAAAGITPDVAELPPFVEAARRGDVLTLINHSDNATHVDVQGTDLRTGTAVDGVDLGPWEWAMLRTSVRS